MLRFFVVAFLFFSTLSITQAEEIKNFSVEYTINDDASVLVEETIVYDFQNEYKHGIFRIIGKDHPQPASVWYKERYLDIDAISVTKNGISEPFKFDEQNSSVEFKVGDPDKTITGQNVYKITYKLTGALSYGDNGAEFYWNVTGNEWSVPINNVSAVVKGKTRGIITSEVYCYQGYFGVNSPCTNYHTNEYGVNFKADSLLVGEGLTIAVGVDSGKVLHVVLEKGQYFVLLVFIFIIWSLFIGYKTYRYRNEFKTEKLPIIAQYEPYADFLPMETGVLLDDRLDPRDITAGVLYLAEQGFIKIKNTQGKMRLFFTHISTSSYEITLLKPISYAPTYFLRRLLQLFFNENDQIGKTVTSSELFLKAKLNYLLLKSLKNDLREDLQKKNLMVYTPSSLFWWHFCVSSIILLASVFVLQLDKYDVAIILSVYLIFYFFFIFFGVTQGLVANFFAKIGISETNYKIVNAVDDISMRDVFVSFPYVFSLFFLISDLYEILFSIFFVVSLSLLFAIIKPKRTMEGEVALNYILGFKLFLSITDKERFDFHNAPERNPELFMKYLPYATALGVERKWAKVFEGMTMSPPSWYDGGNLNNFSATTLITEMDTFSRVVNLSGSSGSSGRGFSGGGGGRGGGGSW